MPSKINWTLRKVLIEEAIWQLMGRNMTYIRIVGRGSFGDVLSFRCTGDTDSVIAVKVTDPRNTWHMELTKWPTFDHPNVLRLREVLRRPTCDLFLMPLLPRNLTELLSSDDLQRNKNAFRITLGILKDVLHGLLYLHGIEICHLDLKSDNILITRGFKAIVGDFSSINETNQRVTRCTLPGILRPPENCVPRWMHFEVDGIGVDMWSFGLLALNTWTSQWLVWEFDLQRKSRLIWRKDVYPLQFKVLQRSEFVKHLHTAFPYCKVDEMEVSLSLNLLHGILRFDPNKRPLVREILRHTLLRGRTAAGLLFQGDSIWTRLIEEDQEFDELISSVKSSDTPQNYTPELRPKPTNPKATTSEASSEIERGAGNSKVAEKSNSSKAAEKDEFYNNTPEDSQQQVSDTEVPPSSKVFSWFRAKFRQLCKCFFAENEKK